jgi:hypothetical protein
MSTEDMNFTCPVCGWPKLEFDPLYSACEFCDCCGTEFGYDDIPESKNINIRSVDSSGNISDEYGAKNSCKHSTREGMWAWLREHWKSQGMIWFDGIPPNEWNPKLQLKAVDINET